MSWTKYRVQKQQYYSGGTWVDIVPLVTRQTAMTSYDTEEECLGERWVDIPIGTDWMCDECPGYSGKVKLTYSNGDIYELACNDSTTLTSGETRPSGYDYSGITEALIGECVTSIGRSAFTYSSGITEINLPSSLTSIDAYAFYKCSGLTSIHIPDSVTYIGINAFASCSGLTSANIPTGLTSIPESLYDYDSNLEGTLEIPSGVTYIGSYAFWGCKKLDAIICRPVVPPTASSSIFGGSTTFPIYVPCDSVDVYKASSGWSGYTSRIEAIPGSCPEPTFNGKLKATYSGGSTFELACNGNSTLSTGDTKPSGYNYSAMTSAIIGSCVTTIGQTAFYNYRILSSVTIPNTVTIIGDTAFASCKSLSSVTIPNSVTSINFNAFGDCSALSSITIPNSVTTIGDAAFIRCSGLTSCTVGSGVTTIGSGFLHGCKSITNVDIPDSVTTISSGLCSGCTSMLSITIGSGVTSIGMEALFSCGSLNSITCKAINPPTMGDNYAFRGTNNCPIYVPSGSVNAYKSAPSWNDCASRITAIPNS